MKIRMLLFVATLFLLIPCFAGAQAPANPQGGQDFVTRKQFDTLRASQRKTDRKVAQNATATQNELKNQQGQQDKTNADVQNLKARQKMDDVTTDARLKNIDHRFDGVIHCLELSGLGIVVLLGAFLVLRPRKGQNASRVVETISAVGKGYKLSLKGRLMSPTIKDFDAYSQDYPGMPIPVTIILGEREIDTLVRRDPNGIYLADMPEGRPVGWRNFPGKIAAHLNLPKAQKPNAENASAMIQ